MTTTPTEGAVQPFANPFDPVAPAAQPPAETYRFRSHATGGDFLFLMLKNVFFTLITLGIYTPWAKTEKRKFIWTNIDLHGERFTYTGTGNELLMGYLKVAAVYFGFVVISGILTKVAPLIGRFFQVGIVLLALVIMPYALYWSRRYLLSRTLWRGIRFGLGGAAGDYAKTYYLGLLLTIVSLGVYAPIWFNRIYAFTMNHTHYGNKSFRYDGSDAEAFRIGLRGFLLSVLTLGIYYFWYRAELTRFRLAHTHFDQAAFCSELSGGTMLFLALLNVFGLAFTFGLAFPWIMTATLRTVMEHLSLQGVVDFKSVAQQAHQGSSTGDGLADVLDVGFGI